MYHASRDSEKSAWDYLAIPALLYVVFVVVVGALFTLMLLFGEPVDEA